MKQETLLINTWGLLWFKIPGKYSELMITMNVRESWLWLASGMKSYLFENKIIEEWTHLLRLWHCFKAILALLLSLKALLITKVVRDSEHILLAHLKSGRRNSSCCHRGIQIGISHAHTHQTSHYWPFYRIWGWILWMWEYTEKGFEYILKKNDSPQASWPNTKASTLTSRATKTAWNWIF